jgi:hypothetical protein
MPHETHSVQNGASDPSAVAAAKRATRPHGASRSPAIPQARRWWEPRLSLIIGDPPKGIVSVPTSGVGVNSSTGIAFETTANAALTDTTAVAAADVIGMLFHG